MKSKKINKTPFEKILDEIEGKEEFLNFDGEDYNDTDDYEYADEYENMTGAVNPHPQKKLYRSNPYQIIIDNPTNGPLKAILYGHDKFLLKPNFGSENGIVVRTGQSGVDYVEYLQRSATHQFKTQHIRIESTNILQLSKSMSIFTYEDGDLIQRQLNLNIYKSAYQNQNNILDIDDIMLDIKGNMYLQWELEKNTSVMISFFPLYEINTSQTLRGNDPIKTFAPARVNSGAVMLRPPKKIIPQLGNRIIK